MGTVSSGRDYNLSILEMREQRGREVKKLVQSCPASQRWGWGLMPASTGQATMPKMTTKVFSRWDVLRGSRGTGSHLILPSLCPHLCPLFPERSILSEQKARAAQAPSAASRSSGNAGGPDSLETRTTTHLTRMGRAEPQPGVSSAPTPSLGPQCNPTGLTKGQVIVRVLEGC